MTREEILAAVQKATETFQAHSSETEGSVDLVSIAEELDVPVVFRPLDNLIGGAVTVGNETGIIIQSSQPHHRQRFTLAHELGHILLGHENQLDDNIDLSRRAHPSPGQPIEEVAANVFASELLAPLDRIKRISKQHNWSKSALQEPQNIYQLSLRLGISFTATCWALFEHDLLSRQGANDLTNEQDLIKRLKDSVIPGDIDRNPWANVWQITRGDDGYRLTADEKDVYVAKFEEKSASGYIWELVDKEDKIDIIYENSSFDGKYGSESSRQIVFQFSSKGGHSISFKHRRPWNDDTIEGVNISIDNRGRELKGLSRDRKQRSLSEVQA